MGEAETQEQGEEPEEVRDEATDDAEDPSDRFVRLAEPRVTKALKAIRLIGNLSGSQYEYDALQVQKIKRALLDAVTVSLGRLERREPEAEGFRF
jgi:hypothetical protein